MKTILKVAVGIILGLCLLVAGCAVIVGSSVNEAVKEVQKESDSHSITAAQFASAKLGSSLKSVRAKLGPYDRRQSDIRIDVAPPPPRRAAPTPGCHLPSTPRQPGGDDGDDLERVLSVGQGLLFSVDVGK